MTVSAPVRLRALVAALLLGMVALAAAAGLFRPADNLLHRGFAALQARPASGQVHIVEMDAASLQAIQRWPWDRSHYARVVDRLNAAGVASIAFDVDFSAPSDPRQDRMLADALARSRAPVVLPTFAQPAEAGSHRSLSALPIPTLRPHASLASVAVIPDRDGIVRAMPLGTATAGLPRPSLSAAIAHRSGVVDVLFPIDFAIDPATIPRHSFVAVESGAAPASLRGKHVLIGATAIEMGDRYAVPRHGVLPGVVVQALAAETLLDGVPSHGGWVPTLLLAAGLAVWLLGARGDRAVAGRGVVAGAALLGTAALAQAAGGIVCDSAPALALLATAAAWRAAALHRQRQEERRCTDTDTGLPNARALRRAESAGGGYTVAAMIANYDALQSVVGPERIGALINRLAERLRGAGTPSALYRVDDRALAWTTRLPHYELDDTLLGLRAVMRSPLEVDGYRVDVALAFGIASDRVAEGAAAHAVHAAGAALASGAPFAYHQAAEQAALALEVSLMGELDQAIEAGELQVLYQPKLRLADDTIASVEALVRWDHPARGLLRPDAFIPLAERSDRIDSLTLYVLRQTIADLRDWCDAGRPIRAAVNISARLLTSRGFLSAAEAVLVQNGVPRDRLIFEVTESATIEHPDDAVAALQRFRALGVAISMDDYGTGQSSLTYLRTLPLSELKIDRSFVQFAHRNRNDALLVRSTVELAHQLGLDVVAEGVEDEACLAFLRKAGCDYAQGYLIGRPMAADLLQARLLEDARHAA